MSLVRTAFKCNLTALRTWGRRAAIWMKFLCYRTHMGDEMKEGVAAQRADGQRHQEAEEELEENSVHERDEDDAQQREQADDRDGDEAADPRCNTHIKHCVWLTRLQKHNFTVCQQKPKTLSYLSWCFWHFLRRRARCGRGARCCGCHGDCDHVYGLEMKKRLNQSTFITSNYKTFSKKMNKDWIKAPSTGSHLSPRVLQRRRAGGTLRHLSGWGGRGRGSWSRRVSRPLPGTSHVRRGCWRRSGTGDKNTKTHNWV